jgi:hypothetical protein
MLLELTFQCGVMIRMKNQTIAIFAITAMVLGSISGIAYGAITSSTITLDNSNRREYVYCPIDTTTLSVSTTYEINGCPTVRIYINNWNTITELDKTSIDTKLRSAGFKDVGEVDARIK